MSRACPAVHMSNEHTCVVHVMIITCLMIIHVSCMVGCSRMSNVHACLAHVRMLLDVPPNGAQLTERAFAIVAYGCAVALVVIISFLN